jgi:prepilin-type N-terminal cleavage/methylation domain-containing protein
MPVLKCSKPGRCVPILGHGRGWQVGYTLVEVMIVVAIIGVLLAVAVPAWAKSRNSARVKVCISNLRQVYAAKLQWAIEAKKIDDDIPRTTDLVPYLRGGLMPGCPIDGTFRIRRVSKYPTCSFYPIGHTLNNDNMDDDAAPD